MFLFWSQSRKASLPLEPVYCVNMRGHGAMSADKKSLMSAKRKCICVRLDKVRRTKRYKVCTSSGPTGSHTLI